MTQTDTDSSLPRSGEGQTPRGGVRVGLAAGETAAVGEGPTLAASPPVPPHKGEGGRRAVIARAREMRKNLTPQEARLWAHLRGLRARGFHFRRQAPFRGYYLDFVCFSRGLVVEVDGGGHGEDIQASHDATRDAVLKREGFRTLRFWNGDIDTNIDGVLRDILTGLQPATPADRP